MDSLALTRKIKVARGAASVMRDKSIPIGHDLGDVVLETDRDCLRMALATIPERAAGPLVVYVRDTLELGSAFVSEACLPLLAGRPDVARGVASPLTFDADTLASPFVVTKSAAAG